MLPASLSSSVLMKYTSTNSCALMIFHSCSKGPTASHLLFAPFSFWDAGEGNSNIFLASSTENLCALLLSLWALQSFVEAVNQSCEIGHTMCLGHLSCSWSQIAANAWSTCVELPLAPRGDSIFLASGAARTVEVNAIKQARGYKSV